jgi:alkylation response protein AidB-like acyl-CoA dehydrogenase
MNAWSEEHRLFQRSVREFCEARLRPLVDEAESEERFPAGRILPAMAELGFFRIGVDEDSGGAGGDSTMHCILAEEIARVCGGFAASVMPSVVGPSLLAKLGTSEQRKALLEDIMNGRRIPAIALTEPGAGSDLLSMRTTAQLDGDTYVLDGSKTFITNGTIASDILVAAVRGEFAERKGVVRAAGISLFIVPRNAPGFQASRKLSKLGMRASETAELVFEECRIPKANRLGDEKVNFLRLMHVLDQNRLYIAALSNGLAQAAFETSCAYAKERKAFGKPIGQHQAVAFKLARMAVDLDAARLLVHRAARLYDEEGRAAKEVSMAKLFATEAAQRITAEAVQIHGGYGYMSEFPVERYFRDAKVGTIWEGTSEVQQLIIARELGFVA